MKLVEQKKSELKLALDEVAVLEHLFSKDGEGHPALVKVYAMYEDRVGYLVADFDRLIKTSVQPKTITQDAILGKMYEVLWLVNAIQLGDISGRKGYLLTPNGTQIFYASMNIDEVYNKLFRDVRDAISAKFHAQISELVQQELNESQIKLNNKQQRINSQIVWVSAIAVLVSAASILLSYLAYNQMAEQTQQMKTNNSNQIYLHKLDSLNSISKDTTRSAGATW